MSNFADLARPEKFVGQALKAPNSLKRKVFIGAVAVAALAAGAGSFILHFRSADAQVSPPAPLAVTAERVEPQTIHPFAQFSGRITAVDYAEIRPQVVGRITEIRFHDGQRVKAGDILFVIDPRPYEAAAAKAKSDLETAINNAKEARLERDRGDRLMQAHALAQESYDQRVNADSVAQAAVGSARALLQQAQLNVDYAYIKAPISGRISRAEITQGNLVGSATTAPPLLASIVSDDGVYADFEVDEATFLNNVRARTADQQQKVPVELQVQGDSGRVYHGTIESFDNHIDAGSGTIRARARFANEDGGLVPGMFVSVRMGSGEVPNALLVPERAIGNDQSKRFVFVVDRDSKAEYRPVTLGTEIDGRRVVTQGLKPGDDVILDGLQRLGPGVAVAAASPQQKTASN
ncbi:MAG TPA: efflux RND transporter periplasmic adaptor subunit [Rhizomicrobium sp.]|nr:efflux RND transporter periplasmic adaptor subunit [Rhizomicrobium sp.]